MAERRRLVGLVRFVADTMFVDGYPGTTWDGHHEDRDMTHTEIEYCVPCGLLAPALETQRALLEEFGQQLDGVQLTPGHGGVFEVSVDGETIWDREVHGGEPDLELIVAAVDDRLEATA